MMTKSQFEDQNSGFLIKAIIVGEANVGKSTILRRFISDSEEKISLQYNQTIGLEFESKEIDINDESDPLNKQKMTLQIWDTAGQESFRSIVKTFYKNSAAVLLVYDVTAPETFEKLPKWIREIKENSHDGVLIVLIGNKRDNHTAPLSGITEDDINKLVVNQGVSFHFFTSAKENYQINETFQYVADQVYQRFIKGQSEYKNGIRPSRAQSTSSMRNSQKIIDSLPSNTDQQDTSKSNQIQIVESSTEKSMKENLISRNDPKTPQKEKNCCTLI